jgi:hypothetical protein
LKGIFNGVVKDILPDLPIVLKPQISFSRFSSGEDFFISHFIQAVSPISA